MQLNMKGKQQDIFLNVVIIVSLRVSEKRVTCFKDGSGCGLLPVLKDLFACYLMPEESYL